MTFDFSFNFRENRFELDRMVVKVIEEILTKVTSILNGE